MASFNNLQLIGNLGRDPVYRSTPSGYGFTTLSLATTRTWRERETNEQKSETEWHRVVLEGKAAETARDYLAKGRLVFVEGRLRTRKYAKDGRDVYITEVVSHSMQMLDRPPETSRSETGADAALDDDSAAWVAEYEADLAKS